MKGPLNRVHLRITAWYVGIFAAILGFFGVAAYLAVTAQIGRTLDRRLAGAVEGFAANLVSAPEEAVSSSGDGERLHTAWDLFLFDHDARVIGSAVVPPFVPPLVREALSDGEAWGRPEGNAEESFRVYARRIVVGNQPRVVLAMAGAVELEDQYRGVLASFLLAALATLVLVAVAGIALARKSLAPVERSVERMRRFVADASHELRTPAAILRTRAEVALQRARSVPEYQEVVRQMGLDAEQLGRLVNGLLLLAAADDDQLLLQRAPVFLDDLLVEAVTTVRPLAVSKGVRLELGEFSEAPIEADPDLVRRLLVILLENAIKYTPPSGRVRADVTTGDGRRVVVIADTGPGISPEELPHVFERFYRGAPAGGRAAGAGLGLAIARSIATAHGADLSLVSPPGGGTTATVAFPARSASAGN